MHRPLSLFSFIFLLYNSSFFCSFVFSSSPLSCPPFPPLLSSLLPLIPNSCPLISFPPSSSLHFHSLPFPSYCLLTSTPLRNSGLFSLLSLGSFLQRRGGKGGRLSLPVIVSLHAKPHHKTSISAPRKLALVFSFFSSELKRGHSLSPLSLFHRFFHFFSHCLFPPSRHLFIIFFPRIILHTFAYFFLRQLSPAAVYFLGRALVGFCNGVKRLFRA